MPWVRLEDSFADHPKIERVGPLAAWLHVTALCYCARHLTDGHIPKGKALRLADVASPQAHVDALLRVGLWCEDGDDYVIHDYLDYQPSRAEIEAERSAARERMAKRRRSPEVRANKSRSSPSPSRPDPLLTSSSSRGNSRGDAGNPVDDDHLSTVPDEAWTHYATLKLQRQPAGKVTDPEPYKAMTARNARTELADQALRWWRRHETTPYRLAQALVAGQPPRDSLRPHQENQ